MMYMFLNIEHLFIHFIWFKTIFIKNFYLIKLQAESLCYHISFTQYFKMYIMNQWRRMVFLVGGMTNILMSENSHNLKLLF